MPSMRHCGPILVALGLALLCACGPGSPDRAEEIISLTIPAAGGTVEGDRGISVVAPPGAVAADTVITIAPKDEAIAGTVGLGAFPAAVECGPSGTTFASPIEIRIPVDEAPGAADCALFSREGTGGAWTQLDQDGHYDAAGKFVALKTTHFSTIAYSGVAAPGVRVFADEFAKAGDHESALRKLRAVLFDDSKVMGLRHKVGEDSYEVCGVDIDVQYKFAVAENQHVGDMTGEKTNDTTILQYYRDDSSFNPDMTIISDTKVTLYWKKIAKAQYLVTYDFQASSGEFLTLAGYSSTMYFTVEVPAEENAAVSMDDEDMIFDAYFNQTAPTSIIPNQGDQYYASIGCPSTGSLLALIGGTTAPGSCGVALFSDEPENFVTALAWGPDGDGGYEREPVLDPELFLIGGDGDDFKIDGSLTVVLQDGYSGSGYAQMVGILGIAKLGYTVNVRKLR
jgi:hypothetical protein